MGIQQMLIAAGAAGGIVSISNATHTAGPGLTPQAAGYELLTDGNIRRIINGVNTDVGDWITPLAAAPGAYEARATVTSGALSTGPASGVWTAISAGTCQWTIIRTNPPSGSGTSTVIFTLDIRNAGGTIVATATITLNATLT